MSSSHFFQIIYICYFCYLVNSESNALGPPASLKVRPTSNSITVSWTPPVGQDLVVQGYIIGYGVGIPDVILEKVDADLRLHTIDGLEPKTEYVISLRAYNNAMEGMPLYETTKTKEEAENSRPLLPPAGLKSVALTSSIIVITWVDTTLGRDQQISDNRHYVVRYKEKSLRKYKYMNLTLLSAYIEDLKPDCVYEFAVRTVRGKRQSAFSVSGFVRTKESVPSSAPLSVSVNRVDGRPRWVNLMWQPPQQPNGRITGYTVFYTTDEDKEDKDWSVQELKGNRQSLSIANLSLDTTYYFKVQVKNKIGSGPMSSVAIYKTPS